MRGVAALTGLWILCVVLLAIAGLPADVLTLWALILAAPLVVEYTMARPLPRGRPSSLRWAYGPTRCVDLRHGGPCTPGQGGAAASKATVARTDARIREGMEAVHAFHYTGRFRPRLCEGCRSDMFIELGEHRLAANVYGLPA